jgi:hypothetical protein
VLAFHSRSRARLLTLLAAVTVGRMKTVTRACHVVMQRPTTGRVASSTARVTPCPPERPQLNLLLVRAASMARRAR